MVRVKMTRGDRAKQFAPFDALKGLQDALRIKEFEHERVQRGEVQEEQASKISKTLLSLEKEDIVWVKYFKDGHYFSIEGKCVLMIEKDQIKVGGTNIFINDIFDIKICKRIEKYY